MATDNYKYELDGGAICQIKLSPEKKLAAGAEPAGALDLPGWYVSVSTSKRSKVKRKPRGFIFSIKEQVGDTERNLVRSLFIPILTPASYNAAAPATLLYDGQTWNFVDKSPEG